MRFGVVGSYEPALNAGLVRRSQMKMAMSAGDNRHYRFDQIHGRHFVRTAMRAGLSRKRAMQIFETVAERAQSALDVTAATLPAGFPRRLWPA